MFEQIIKTAKNLIAKNQSKKLLQYFIDDKYKDNNPSQNEIQTLKNKIQQIQQNSFNFPWFVNRFITQKKHYQDIDPLLDVQLAYKRLNKELRTFQFTDNNTFSDFNNFMESYLNKNIKNQDFQEPSYCKLIHSDGKYNYYYADANDKKCYQDLHQCNMIDKNGQDNRKNQYAKWCVVTGTRQWGSYTTSWFPFYIYVTDNQNVPVMLCNFGYDSDAQIKDIHDDPFTQYDQELLKGIKYLANKYNFDIQENEDDFYTFNEVDKLYSKQINPDKIDQNIITESSKYNGLNFIKYNIIYDFNKNQKAYLIAGDSIINLKGYKINLYLLNLLKDKDYNTTILTLAKNDKFISSCSQQIQNFIIKIMIDNEQYVSLSYLIEADKIKDANQLKQSIQVFIDKEQYESLYDLIKADKIKDKNQLKQSIQVLIDKEFDECLSYLIEDDKIKDENQIKEIIQALIDKEFYTCLSDLIEYDKIKDENQLKQSIQVLIDYERYGDLSDLINRNKINQTLLTQEQKELLKKKYPNIKLSKKLVEIAKILRL